MRRTLRKSLLSANVFVAIIAVAPLAVALPPSGDDAKQAVETSPRHGEYVFVPMPDSDVKLRTWVSYPERADKAPVVIVIHEIFGMTDWIRSVADALAAEGYIAVAPDLISGMEGAEENPRETIGRLEDSEAINRLNVTLDYAQNLPAAGDTCAVMGFCWGGKTSFLYATAQPELDAAIVYYGTSPETSTLTQVNAPVLGLYGENDARVNSTIEEAERELNRLGKSFEKEIYAGAGHGFLRQQSGQDGANQQASEKAWERTLAFLNEHTGG
ncbi:MAG: dienelactone hydrolase family protein [Candidatus Hydrogenedentes bacterium]|nr:dienelactone hydrolase family protein [Candidatus Hydrogenedentota bacterium]